MNLYLFNANDSAATYGIGTYLNELTGALAGTEIRIHIVHLHADRPEFEIVTKELVEHWYIPDVCNKSTASGLVLKLEDYYRNVVYLLLLNMNDTKDLVFHFNYNHSYWLAKRLKEVFTCQTECTVHFMKWSQELLGNVTRLQAIKTKPPDKRTAHEQLLIDTDEYESRQYKASDRVIALSDDMKQFLNSAYRLEPEKVTIIPNGLHDLNSEKGTDRYKLRKKWHLSENELSILFVGRLHPVKGISFLIRAFRKVLEQMPDCRLIIAGGGHDDRYRKEATDISRNVTFTGLLEKKDLLELYQIADVGVIPSLYEPFGLVALEMMMHELPIVSTSTSGLNEVVDEQCGLKIPVIEYQDRVEIDVNLLAEKILYLLHHPDEAKTMGQNGRKRYLQKYTSEVFRTNMLNLYRSLYAVYS